MRHFLVSWLVFKNNVEQTGLSAYLWKIGPLSMMNIALFSLLFATVYEQTLSVAAIMRQYVYFIPLTALSSGLATWETELFEGIGESYLLSGGIVVTSRLLQVIAETAVPALFFLSLLYFGGGSFADAFSLLIMLISFSIIGIGLGLFAGFRSEKAINNMLNLAIWTLGFGPGPFFSDSSQWYQSLFPGSHALRGDFVGEWRLLIGYTLVGIGMALAARRPRSYRIFSK